MAPIKHLDPPPPATHDATSFELLRVWIAGQGQHVSLRSGVWEDPYAWGIVLADLARRHIVHAESLARKDIDQDIFLKRMLEGFQAEIESPTDDPDGQLAAIAGLKPAHSAARGSITRAATSLWLRVPAPAECVPACIPCIQSWRLRGVPPAMKCHSPAHSESWSESQQPGVSPGCIAKSSLRSPIKSDGVSFSAV